MIRSQAFRTLSVAVAALATLSAIGQTKAARHWSGTASVAGTTVPVVLDLSAVAKNGSVQGTFLNGDERASSSSGTLTGSHLVLRFSSFARTLEGELKGSELKATYSGARLTAAIPLQLRTDRDGKPATTFRAAEVVHGKAATVNGDWEMAVKSAKGESAWTLRVAPFGGNGEIKAVILKVDGDTGGLYGRFDEAAGEYRVGHFSDAGAAWYALHPEADGSLRVTNLLHPDQVWTARRPAAARQAKLAPPTAATEQTTVIDPSQPLRWQGPNLGGEMLQSTDDTFRNKVVIVAVGGSWCPNCHDEAPLLVELYRRYHARGLEVVNLSFEEEDQLKNPERLRAFVTQYAIPYPVLVMGTPDDLNERLPQGKNLNCWPTSFFVGRDGLVKETHAGFSGPATGAAYTSLRTETFALVEKLLAQR